MKNEIEAEVNVMGLIQYSVTIPKITSSNMERYCFDDMFDVRVLLPVDRALLEAALEAVGPTCLVDVTDLLSPTESRSIEALARDDLHANL